MKMDKVRIAVIGIKGFGFAHIKAVLSSNDAVLVKVCDIDEEVAKERSQEFKVPYCTDYNEIFNDPEIDAVTLALPDQLHSAAVAKALAAGKHVLCEKPLALTMDDCHDIVKASAESSKKFMVGQICRYTPSFIKAKQLVESGVIGDLFFIESEYAHDYEDIHTPWRQSKAKPRHPMVGGACHAVDLIRWIAGNPTEVFGYSNHFMLPDWPTDDCTVGVMKFANGVMGKVFCSTGCKRRYTMRTVIYGSKGTIIVDNRSDTMSLFRDTLDGEKKFFDDKCENFEIKIPVIINDHNIDGEIADFIRIVLNDETVDVTAKEGASTVAVCNAIIESANTGETVKVNYNF